MGRTRGDERLGIDNSPSEAMIDQGNQRFTLPSLRYTNVVLGIIFVDGLASAILWLTGKTNCDIIIYMYVQYI